MQALKKPITFSLFSMFTSNLPSSCVMDGKSCGETYTLEMLVGVKKSRFILGYPTTFPAVLL